MAGKTSFFLVGKKGGSSQWFRLLYRDRWSIENLFKNCDRYSGQVHATQSSDCFASYWAYFSCSFISWRSWYQEKKASRSGEHPMTYSGFKFWSC